MNLLIALMKVANKYASWQIKYDCIHIHVVRPIPFVMLSLYDIFAIVSDEKDVVYSVLITFFMVPTHWLCCVAKYWQLAVDNASKKLSGGI